MYQVLVAVDENRERALTQVEAVSEIPEAADNIEAVLLHVFTDNPEGVSIHQIPAIRRAKESLEEAGIDVSMVEASGNPSEEIRKHAREMDVDLISVAGRGKSPAGKALLGSISQDVLLDTDRPVLFTTTNERSE